jgi:hypothetical protein
MHYRLFSNASCDAKANAQRNLSGRTHYADDDTLRGFHCRIISARTTDQGLLFAIVTSDAKDFENRSREFRFVIFDIFGTVLERPKSGEGFRTSAQATKAMWTALNGLDAKAHTLEAIEEQRLRAMREFAELSDVVGKMEF